ncbi:enoyl-CoA hydratase/isomerase family protein [Blastococcus haudaquaticus]|uniref:2-(1,2-epoxy-1,2-dihydrophenyl)acetyl-CoA isomerase n=1 Tax=Blastococcus haudaquaticus TaxID=1938745 RepID=A0A286GZR2_9ACTN|nr:enoyl-CoA hydratase-related protein [Blastococcus haudaquaticus]SOE01013.1 2-(1,2-epoxy-1,2-dihydrophenyl)acetyl-CoA isomerase [Blastococcus haudaquaticus]
MTAAQDRPAVLTEVDGDVWRITLDNPDTGNALTPQLASELAAAFAGRPDGTRVVLLTANGPRFCVGGDVRSFADAADPGTFVGRLAHDWHEVIRAVLYCPVPVVAGVHGAVAGAGVGLVGACDVVICARTTKIRPAYGAIGFSPDGGTSWALTRSLGAPRALDLMLTNGSLTAAEAHLTGLVARLVEDEDLRRTTEQVAREIADGPIRAMVRTRALVRRAATRTLEEQLDDEAQLVAESAADPEGREGVRAFVEKRAPDFRNAR